MRRHARHFCLVLSTILAALFIAAALPRPAHAYANQWVVDARTGRLERYWYQKDGTLARNRLVGPSEGDASGYYAWAMADGRILRGKYDDGRGHVYVADNNGKLIGSDYSRDAWVVTAKYDGHLERYRVDAKTHAARSGFFNVPGYGDCFGYGGQGYVCRGPLTFGGRRFYANNDGQLVHGWACTAAFGQGFQRYWFGDSAYGVSCAMAVNRLVSPSEGSGWWAFARPDGTILRGKWDTGRGRVYVADNNGKLLGSDMSQDGWVVTAKYDGHLERYYVDASDKAACSGFFSVKGYGDCFGLGGQGYVLRGQTWFGGRLLQADNDGRLISSSSTTGAGPLHVSGTRLCDASGHTVRLQGASTHGIAWYPQYVSEATFRTLRDDWGANCVRLANYSQENGGWCSGGDRNGLRSTIDRGVNVATDLGMYAIIDWHILSDGNPQTHQGEAIEFFREMSARYANHTNVIYEICNEPNSGASWSDNIKPYAEAVIPVIRANDPDAIIIVGTPNWSQNVDEVASNPLRFGNVMYALHFYAATHKDDIRNRATRALSAGTPLFVTECSICDASGNGGIDYGSAEAWRQLIANNNLSYCCWSLSNKGETSSLIASWCNKTSGWSTGELTDTGRWFRSTMRSFAGK